MWPNPQETADLVSFTEEIPNGKLQFLCSDITEYSVRNIFIKRSSRRWDMKTSSKSSRPEVFYKKAVLIQRCFIKKLFLGIFQHSQENTCARVSFLIKLQAWKKETLAQMFSCEFCRNCKNAFLQSTSWRLLLLDIQYTQTV